MRPVTGAEPTPIPSPLRDRLTERPVHRCASPAAAGLAVGRPQVPGGPLGGLARVAARWDAGGRRVRALPAVQGWLLVVVGTHAAAWVATVPAAFLAGWGGVSGPGAGWVVLGSWVGAGTVACPWLWLHLVDVWGGRGDE